MSPLRAVLAYWRAVAVAHGYWLRPYDPHLDARRWRWQRSGRQRTQRYFAEHPELLGALERAVREHRDRPTPEPEETTDA